MTVKWLESRNIPADSLSMKSSPRTSTLAFTLTVTVSNSAGKFATTGGFADEMNFVVGATDGLEGLVGVISTYSEVFVEETNVRCEPPIESVVVFADLNESPGCADGFNSVSFEYAAEVVNISEVAKPLCKDCFDSDE